MMETGAALANLRICDLTTGFAGPSATRWLAAFGAEVIRVDDVSRPDATLGNPVQHNNLNVGKLGLAVDLGGRRGRRLAAELAAVSHVICVDHPGLRSVGLDLDNINGLRPKGQPEPVLAVGPEHDDRSPLPWLDLAVGMLEAVYRQVDSGLGATVLAAPADERSSDAPIAVHPCSDGSVVIDCRDDGDWAALAVAMGLDVEDAARGGDAIDDADVARWCRERSRWDVEAELRSVDVPVAALRRPGERIDRDIATGARHLWPMVDHPDLGGIRVEGLAVEMSRSTWAITEPAPLVGQDTHWILSHVLGRSDEEIERLHHLGVVG